MTKILNRDSARENLRSMYPALKTLLAWVRVGGPLASLAFFAPAGFAQSPGTGAISGRILDASNGSYLNDALVTVDGTNLQTLTDRTGAYLLGGVPPGEVTVKVFYTGLAVQSGVVSVAAGQTAHRDFSLVSVAGAAAKNGEIVTLDPFVVEENKTMDQKAIAINEQRFAAIGKAVVSTDQFGEVAEDNIGEFLKYMPGVSIEYTAADARQIILRGINPIYTDVFVDGNRMASAASSGADRYFEFEQVSINNVSRVEVNFSRTPDLPADALGGSVNMISKGGFDVARPTFNYRVYTNLDPESAGRSTSELSSYADQFSPSEGPAEDSTRKAKGGFDFSFMDPVSSKFAFAINFLDSNEFNEQHETYMYWSNANSGPGSTATNPYLQEYQMFDGPKYTQRYSAGARLDFKISDTDTVSMTPQWNYYNAYFNQRTINFKVNGTTNTAPTSWDGPNYVNGAPEAGNVNFTPTVRQKFGTTYQDDLLYTHHGPQWTYDLGVSDSHASDHYHDGQDGTFEAATLTLSKVTVSFSGMNQYDFLRPAQINVTDANNNPVNAWNDLGNFTISNGSLDEEDSADQFRSVHSDVERSIDWANAPTTFKVGVKYEDHIRDIRTPALSFTFIGPGGTAGGASTLGSNFLPGLVDPYSSVAPPFGLPQIQYPNTYYLYSLLKNNPTWWTENQTSAIETSAEDSKYIDEEIGAAYVMGDTKLLRNRLRLVYGVRFELTHDSAQGPVINPNAIYVPGTTTPLNGPNGLPLTNSSNTTLATEMEYLDRASHTTDQYASGYPSIAATYEITDNLQARFSYARALGRPDFTNIIPGVTLPNPTGSTPYAISVDNTALKPEQADNYDASLEYYFSNVGAVSISVWEKVITNFYGASTELATAANLATYNIPDPSYYLENNATITSNFNTGTMHDTGVQLDYKQELTFFPLPGFSVFATGYTTHLNGSPLADFSNFISKALNLGVAYDRRRFSAKVNFNYRGVQREAIQSYVGVTGAYQYYAARHYYDIDFGYWLSPRVELFLAGRNVTNTPQDQQKYGPPMPGYTHLITEEEFGALYTVGIKGTF